MWALQEYGRRVFRRQALTSDNRLTLMSGPVPERGGQQLGSLRLLTFAHSESEAVVSPHHSAGRSIIIRRQHDAATYLPPALLEGVLPAVLLENFRFWSTANGLTAEPLPGALASLARFLSDSGGAGASTTLSVASVRAAMGLRAAREAKNAGGENFVGDRSARRRACWGQRGGGFVGGAGTLRPRGAVLFLRLRTQRLGNFATDTKTTSSK